MKFSLGRRPLAGAATAVLLALAQTGCGGPRVGSIAGTVTYQGRPLPTGRVMFHWPNDTEVRSSRIAADGTYRLEAVPVGSVTITVEAVKPVARGVIGAQFSRELGFGSSGPTTPPPAADDSDFVAIPDRYREPGRSGLAYEVKGGRQTHDLDLGP
jgi:hypothetical protein